MHMETIPNWTSRRFISFMIWVVSLARCSPTGAQRNGAAVDVVIPSSGKAHAHRHGLCGKSFVQLDQADILERKTASLSAFGTAPPGQYP